MVLSSSYNYCIVSYPNSTDFFTSKSIQNLFCDNKFMESRDKTVISSNFITILALLKSHGVILKYKEIFSNYVFCARIVYFCVFAV